MLVRLMYASRAADSVNSDVLAAILKKSKSNNPPIGVTGVLCFSGGIFLQVLEGGRTEFRNGEHSQHADARLEARSATTVSVWACMKKTARATFSYKALMISASMSTPPTSIRQSHCQD
jgi:hypothetical protein